MRYFLVSLSNIRFLLDVAEPRHGGPYLGDLAYRLTLDAFDDVGDDAPDLEIAVLAHLEFGE